VASSSKAIDQTTTRTAKRLIEQTQRRSNRSKTKRDQRPKKNQGKNKSNESVSG
jgi:hypothetical protein